MKFQTKKSYYVTFYFVIGIFGLNSILHADDSKPNLDAYRRAVSSNGASERGSKLFIDKRTTCSVCHSVDGRGGKVGPDLLGIADKMDREGLIRAVLEPSADILPGYETVVVSTKSGVTQSGILKYSSEREIELALADGKQVRIARNDIDDMKSSRQSLMPDNLHTAISTSEFADLIAYLETLHLPPPTTAARPDNPDRIARATKPLQIQTLISPAADFQRPVWFGPLTGREKEYLAVEVERAKIWRVQQSAGNIKKDLFLDVYPETRHGYIEGILGFALHPEFAKNRRYFVAMHDPARDKVIMNIWERKANSDGTADSGEQPKKLLAVEMPHVNHNGCCLEFGPDGYLYISFGDGGPQEDPNGHSQNLGSYLGKILRIDVSKNQDGKPYSIPESNPFLKQKNARPEIYALGFREPWRLTFDRKTGDMWVGDVGQNRFEEVAVVKAGENHGWNVFEGFEPFSSKHRRDNEKYTPPLLSYDHRHGVSVTGGYVYRGMKSPKMEGLYIFGDYETRKIWALSRKDARIAGLIEIGRSPSRIAAFGEDTDGELFLIGQDPHAIYRLDLSTVDPTPILTHELVATSEKAGIPWRFVLNQPPANWQLPSFDDSSWKTSPGGFGTRGTPGAIVRTEWRTADIWLRREFSLTEADVQMIKDGTTALRLCHDEDAEIYLNGVAIARPRGFVGQYVELPLDAAAIKNFKAGKNTMAVHCHQTVGGQYIDVGFVQYRSMPVKTK